MKTVFKRFLLPVIYGTLVAVLLLAPVQLGTPVYAQEPEAEFWAVIVGVSNYEYYDIEILTAGDDTQELANQLGPVWGADHIKLLLDSEATKEGIRKAITSWLASREDANDTVLIYFSIGAHTSKDWIMPYDARYAETWLTSGELDSWLDTLDSENIVIIIEANHAGRFEMNLSGSGRVIIMACRSDEQVWYNSSLKHHYFTYYLLQALKNFDDADANYDYELSAEEIFQYAEPETVSEHSDQQPVLSDRYSGELGLLMKFIFNTEPDLPPVATILTLDNKTYSSIPPAFIWTPGSAHNLEIPSLVDTGSGTRYVFTSWDDGETSVSRTISQGGVYTANYTTQYQLIIESAYGQPEGEGWYDSGSTASISAASTEGATTRQIFNGWSGDFTGTIANASVNMDSPKAITANWRTEHLLTIESAYGEPKGEGWYGSGSTATISVTSPEGTIIRQVFQGWSGDFTGDSASASVTMNGPKTITAIWKTDYTQLYFVAGGGAVILGAIIALFVAKSRSKKVLIRSVAKAAETKPLGKCPNCGSEVQPGDVFCDKCGKSLAQ